MQDENPINENWFDDYDAAILTLSKFSTQVVKDSKEFRLFTKIQGTTMNHEYHIPIEILKKQNLDQSQRKLDKNFNLMLIKRESNWLSNSYVMNCGESQS